MTSSETVLYEVREHVAYLSLNRPERLNAINGELKSRLLQLISEVTLDDGVRVVVLRGEGGRAFSVGADLKDMHGNDDRGIALQTPMGGNERNIFEAFLEIPKPTMASIQGYALAGGFELALACDVRIAARSSVFGMPEAKIGMGANFASVLLPRLVPRHFAFEVLYSGERFDTARALEMHLLNRVVDAEELAHSTEKWATEMAANAPLSLFRYKEMFLKGWELPVPAALRLNAGPNPYTSEDRKEGVRAFLEKRSPQWRAV